MSETVAKTGAPNDWPTASFRSLTRLMTNGFVGTATTSYVKSDAGVQYVQGYNVEENAFNLRDIRRVSVEFHQRNQRSCLRRGDVLTIQTGDIGVTAVVPDWLEGANCHALIISRLDIGRCDPDYYSQYFNSPRARTAFKEIETGSTMKHLNVGDVARLVVPVPPLREQRAIAAALRDVDALIGALDRLIAKKRDLKQAAMQQLLTGQTRLPGFRQPWRSAHLEELARIRNDKIFPHLVPRDTPCIELEHIGAGDGRLHSYSTARDSTSAKYRFQKGDVLFGRLRSYLKKFWLAEHGGICTTEVWPLAVDPHVGCSGFLHAVVQGPRFLEAAALSYGTHMPRADWRVVKAMHLLIPLLDEQSAIAAVLSDMDAEITALEQRRDKTRLLKQGMMQELLTGKTRLV